MIMSIDPIDEDPFILVTSKRQKSKKGSRLSSRCKQLHSRSKNFLLNGEGDGEIFDKSAELRKISDFKHKIENSDYFQQSIEILSNETKFPITKIVCFGIGQIRQCNTSRYQLAYILALRSHLKLKSIQFHEPILNHHDGDLLNELHCELDPENVEGKVELDSSQTTLVFLPHCPKQLINNLLWKNWSAKALRRTILIGNSFRSIIQQTPISCVAQDAGFINQIERYTAEFSLRNSFEYKNIFNDISIHFFNTEHCEDNFFDICLEPSYDLSELIERFDSDLKISKNG